ncbi:hypothetical protein JOB18_034711 [Solea senegalensis]|uniref:Uncharacterized protein n=1 Tax=Solea senegalensis TaxID=28829 RepID=A0AAV6PUV5_SOLSE|nr:hypothetical protein JOB18_034711 [Solea senegalensis]
MKQRCKAASQEGKHQLKSEEEGTERRNQVRIRKEMREKDMGQKWG